MIPYFNIVNSSKTVCSFIPSFVSGFILVSQAAFSYFCLLLVQLLTFRINAILFSFKIEEKSNTWKGISLTKFLYPFPLFSWFLSFKKKVIYLKHRVKNREREGREGENRLNERHTERRRESSSENNRCFASASWLPKCPRGTGLAQRGSRRRFH